MQGIFRADSDAAGAIGAFAGRDHSGFSRLFEIEHLGFRANPDTFAAVGTGGRVKADSQLCRFSGYCIKCTEWAQVPAPAVLENEQVKYKDGQQCGPAEPHAKNDTSMEHADRADPFESSNAGDHG